MMNNQKQERQPVFFIPHGAGPCFFMDWNPADAWDKTANFLKSISASLPQAPKAIVLVSGHWLEPQFTVTGHAKPELIYDYYGFPAHTYELTYPTPGEPALAEQVADLITQHGLAAQVHPERGYDHGVFIPLKVAFPKADIPVIQLSLRQDMAAKAHIEMGKALASLRDENVLIIGSGMSFHNMRGYGDPRFTPISAEFDTWLTNAVESDSEERDELLGNWTQAPHARLCHPTGAEEHLLPLLVAAGAAQDAVGKKVFSDKVLETTISAFRFD